MSKAFDSMNRKILLEDLSKIIEEDEHNPVKAVEFYGESNAFYRIKMF